MVIAPLLIAFGVLAAGCGGGSKAVVALGRSLELHVTRPEIVEKVAFLDAEGRHRVIRPRATNRQLAVVNVIVVNRTSTVIPLLIDADAAQLGDRRGERIDALDPFKAAKLLDVADPEENKYSPILWGEVVLERNFQVAGWLVFDVPKGLTLGSLWWGEVDDVIADFVDYFRG